VESSPWKGSRMKRAIIRSSPQSEDKIETPQFQLAEIIPLEGREWPKILNGRLLGWGVLCFRIRALCTAE
jgi:hypothetical protein